MTLSVPCGALSEYTEFTAVQKDCLPASDILVAGSTYEIGPTGIAFTKLVTLTLAYHEGSVPPDVGQLTLHGQSQGALRGSIPSSITTLAHLEVLSLAGNELSGSIPPELGNLSNLTHLRLPRNQLSGGIPPELGNLSSLVELNLMDNDLSGSIRTRWVSRPTWRS